MPQKILLTRPRASSERWAKLLSLRGFDCMIEPLLAIEPLPEPRPAGDFQAVLLTSANAPDALEIFKEQVGDLFALPCFCVGASTAGAARAVGFSNILCGASDSAAMARMVADHISDKTRPLLHIAGDVVDDKARAILDRHGLSLTGWTVYRAVAAGDLTADLCGAVRRGEIAAMPVFSPRSARIFVSLIEKNRLGSACASIRAVALSQTVADVLQNLPWRSLCVAAAPSEEEVLACLQNELSQPDDVMISSENPAALLPQPPKKKNGFIWRLLALILILAMVGWAVHQRATKNESDAPPVLETAAAPAVVASVSDENAAPVVADTAALNEKIAALETELAQLKNKQNGGDARRLVARLAAFDDLRDAARHGQNFTASLAALRAVAQDDAAIMEQTGLLEKEQASAAPDMAHLRADLASREAHIAMPEDQESDVSLASRLKKIVRPLISVHPLRNPQFVALEAALDHTDSQAALAAYAALPDDTQKALGDFGASLRTRADIDKALAAIDVHFTNVGGEP